MEKKSRASPLEGFTAGRGRTGPDKGKATGGRGWNRSPRGDRYLPTVAGTLWMVPSWRPRGCIHACGELPTQPMEHARQSPPVSFFSVAGAVPARYPLAQSDQESSLGVSSLAVGNTVSPPSVTLLRYMSTVA